MKIYIAFLIAALFLSGCASDKNEKAVEPIMCTQDAKQCPDGSWVSRQAPDCQFAACPNQSH